MFRKNVSSAHVLHVYVSSHTGKKQKKKKKQQLEGNLSVNVHARSQLSRAHRQRMRIVRVIAAFTYSHRQVETGSARYARYISQSGGLALSNKSTFNVRFAILLPGNLLYFERL